MRLNPRLKLFYPVLIAMAIIGFALGWIAKQSFSDNPAEASPVATTSPELPSSNSSPTMIVTAEPILNPSPTTQINSSLFYPTTRYTDRLTIRPYGQQVGATDNQGFTCGDPFTGIHNADDLEALSGEIGATVPVYAIASGTIKMAEPVAGYGGLVVIEHIINGKMITSYYGHVALDSNYTIGKHVNAGEQIAKLGEDCSADTSNERKHLHFSIREGSSIDVRGYIESETELSEWLNPKQFLETANAGQPQ